MDLRWDDTIAALASPPGPGWRGILRLTGPATIDVLRELFTVKVSRSVPSDRDTDAMAWQFVRRPTRFDGLLYWPECRAPLSASLQLWPTPRSYTGQPLAELHLVSSPPLLEAVLSELFRRGARPARPGEFTLRAFLAGKLDLLQAEAVLAVIDAHDHAELKTALEQLAGGISHALTALRSDLLNLLADLEAGLDFVDEHLEFVTRSETLARLTAAHATIAQLRDRAAGRSHSGDLPRVVLAGLPNAGKSTLFNALVGTSQALVSPVAGTTRDYLSARVTWDGQTLELIDTAGYGQFTNDIDAAAQQLGQDQWQRGDLTVWCTSTGLSAREQTSDGRSFSAASQQVRNIVRIETKSDLRADDIAKPQAWFAGGIAIPVSATASIGLDELKSFILRSLANERARGRHWLGATAARCQESLRAADDALVCAIALSRENLEASAVVHRGEELLALEIRDALEHLGAIVGAVYTNDLLDRIFSRFCIGK